MTLLYFVNSKFILHRIWPSWLLNKKHDFWKRPFKGFTLSTQNLLCREYGHLTWADMIWGKPFYFVHPKFTLLFMSILTLEQILIWVLVLVLVLDMKVLDVLKYFLKNEYLTSTCTWYIFGVLGVLEYLVNCTWPQPCYMEIVKAPDRTFSASEYFSEI